MSSTHQEDTLLRRYLLHQVDELEREQLETKLFLDPGYQEEVMMVEEELLEDYLHESLPAEDRARFERHYLAIPQQLQKFLTAKALDQYCSTATLALTTAIDDAPEIAPTLVNRPRPKRIIYAWAATFLVVSLVGLWVFLKVWQPQSERRLRQELVRLNAAGNPEVPGQTITLMPVTLRGAEVPQLSPAGPAVQELLLSLPADSHQQRYGIELRRIEDGQIYSLDNLSATATGSGHFVSIKLPARLMKAGDYSMTLVGFAAGAVDNVADYSFRVK